MNQYETMKNAIRETVQQKEKLSEIDQKCNGNIFNFQIKYFGKLVIRNKSNIDTQNERNKKSLEEYLPVYRVFNMNGKIKQTSSK